MRERDFYRALCGVDPNAENDLLTVIDGSELGAKCLLSNGTLRYETDSRFFSAHSDTFFESLVCGETEIDGQRLLCERLSREAHIVLCGGGYVSMALLTVSRTLGIPVTVLEDRAEFADHARAAGADRVICAPFERGLARIEGDDGAYFIIATRGHESDKVCLAAIARKKYAYIGMLGSRKRVSILKQALIDEGAPKEVIARVHAPIGLDIAAETPGEIAVSVMAEIIAVKNRSGRSAGFSREILRAILEERESEPLALATIVRRSGSAPRSVGTRMLARADGRCTGTIGGGFAEAKIRLAAQNRLQNIVSEPEILRIDMTNPEAAQLGMICGGTIEVLLETI